MVSDKNSRLRIEEYQGQGEDWNTFASSHPESRFCHLWQYCKLIEEIYGYRAYGFVVREGDQIIATLPASLSITLLFGKKLVSQPFSEYGGILSQGLSSADYAAFFRYLAEFCSEQGIAHVEMHGNLGVSDEYGRKYFIQANPYGYAVLKLGSDPEVIRREVFDHQIRKALNKAERSGVKSFQDSSPEIIRDKFWPLFLQSMKRIGSPPHPLAYLIGLKRHFPAELKIFWAEVNGKLVAALMGFVIGRRIQITNIVSDESYWDLRTNDLVHWEFIKWGCQNAYLEFDFGSVRYEGQLRYKKKWGAQLGNSGYYYFTSMPDSISAFSSSSTIMTAFSKAWGWCIPLSVTPILGPAIRKQLVR